MSLIAAGAVTAAIVAVACAGSPSKRQAAKVERGKYLVTVGGCNDCHTPLKLGPKGPEPDMSRMLSGHPENFPIAQGATPSSQSWMMIASASGTAFSGPWGVSFTANLTPDQNTGLGIWTEDMFMKAIRTGRHMGASREILPPMPWFNYREMSDADLKAVYAYLRTIPAIHNRVPAPLPPPAPQTARNDSAESAATAAQ
jgi:mono/diheme cytochrome c family protein